MKKNYIVFAICFGVWAIILWITSQTQAASDGFNTIGFPFVFYREFYGKGNHAELNLGMNYINLIIDLLLVLLLAWAIISVLKRKKQYKK